MCVRWTFKGKSCTHARTHAQTDLFQGAAVNLSARTEFSPPSTPPSRILLLLAPRSMEREENQSNELMKQICLAGTTKKRGPNFFFHLCMCVSFWSLMGE